MYGRKAADLIRGLDRVAEETIPLYNGEGVRAVCEEMRTIHTEIAQDKEKAAMADAVLNSAVDSQDDGTANTTNDQSLRNEQTATKMRHLRSADFRNIAQERNQRVLVAYHYNRSERLRHLRWSYGAVLPQEVRANLSEKEKDWFSSYCTALNHYMLGLNGLNLTLHQLPPQDHLLHVRVLIDFGNYETEDGEVISLRKFTRHVLPRSECENLIRQGVLEHITG